MRAAIPRLEKRIAELQALDPETIADASDPSISALEQAIDETLAWIFGERSDDYARYCQAGKLDLATTGIIGPRPHISETREGLSKGKQRAITILQGIIARFQEELELVSPEASSQQPSTRVSIGTDYIFVVHGHDEGAREAIARFLERLDLKPIILHEQASQGRTIIEKIEAHGDVGFAVVLLTPDDIGGARSGEMQPRPRQNVLLELGYFIGRLGRGRVCALKRGEMELPTDFAGVVWESFDDPGGWKQKLGRELETAGFKIDWNKVMRS